MPKSFYALLILTAASGPAWSQTSGENARTGSWRHAASPLSGDARAGVQGPEDRQQCLVRKSNGRVECRSIAGWRRLAGKIDEARGVPGRTDRAAVAG